MTQCTAKPLAFSSLSRRRVEADFDGGHLTSDAGALLLREVDRRLGLTERLAACLTDPRDPGATTHTVEAMLRQRVFGIALGYEDLNDHQTLRDDLLMKVLAERPPEADQPLASPSTLCRLDNAALRRDLVAMTETLVETFIASHAAPPERLVLDVDATDDLLHGEQEGRFFHGYYDAYCYLPLYVFSGDQLLVPYLRSARIDAAKHSRAILTLLVRRPAPGL
ncbi:MAG: transposase, partial [Phycisphaerae bacterium]